MVLGLPTDANPEQITTAITALKTALPGDQSKLTDLEAEVAALKDREATREAEGLVEVALKEGNCPRPNGIGPWPTPSATRMVSRPGWRCAPSSSPRGTKLGVLKDGDKGAEASRAEAAGGSAAGL